LRARRTLSAMRKRLFETRSVWRTTPSFRGVAQSRGGRRAMKSMHFLVGATLVAVAATTNGCKGSTVVDNTVDLNCPEFMPGAGSASGDFKVDASISQEFGAFAQAASDVVTVVGIAREDVTVACQNIAVDLGDDADRKRPGGTDDGAGALDFWCGEAADKITATLESVFYAA